MKRIFNTGFLCLLFVSSLFIVGCSSTDEEGFAIYLTKDDIPPSRMEMLSHVEIADEPVISIGDVISYDAVTHEIELTSEAYARITEMKVPTSGTSFLVCINKSPVYWGAFWVSYSSQSFDGVTIWMPIITRKQAIKIELGYPWVDFHSGKDPRNNTDIMQSLKDSGKLANELPITFIDELPRSFKGWELYSWQKNSEWQFRLITGTNRNKTSEEILSDDTTLNGLASIRISGVEALLSVLSKLPEGEEVIWMDGRFLTSGDEETIEFVLPEEKVVSRIKRYAEMNGFSLAVIKDQVSSD